MPSPGALSLEAYQTIEQLEEEPIEFAETYLRSKFHDPWTMDQVTRALGADFGYLLSFVDILEPYVRHGIPEDRLALRHWKAIDREWTRMTKIELATFAKSFDNQPTKFFYARAVLLNRRPLRYWQISPDSLVSELVNAGSFGVVYGPPNSGKSDMAVKLAEILIGLWEDHRAQVASGNGKRSRLSLMQAALREESALRSGGSAEPEEASNHGRAGMGTATDFRVLSNISTGTGHAWSKYFTYVSTAHDLHIQLSDNDDAGAYTLVILDEYSRAATRGAQTKEKRWIESAARTMRKPRASLLYCTQDYGDITPVMQRWIETRIEKVDSSHPGVAIATVGRTYRYRRILGIPSRTVPFNSRGYGSYIQDINEEELAAVIGEAEGSTDANDPAEASRRINSVIRGYCKNEFNWTTRVKQVKPVEAKGAKGRKGAPKPDVEAPDAPEAT